MKNIDTCQSCGRTLIVSELTCPGCKSTVKGRFIPSVFSLLTQTDQRFIETFVMCRGNIREVEKRLDISYPTVRNRLNAALEALGKAHQQTRARILDELEAGTLSVEEAITFLQDQ